MVLFTFFLATGPFAESFGIESGIAYPIQLCVTKLLELGEFFSPS
jgi:hypothetical protein